MKRQIGMKEKIYKYPLDNNDLVIYEIREVNDSKYKDGIMYTLHCMSADGKTLFAIENSHGKPHIHWRGRKEDADYGWKTAIQKFEEMLKEHKRKTGQAD